MKRPISITSEQIKTRNTTHRKQRLEVVSVSLSIDVYQRTRLDPKKAFSQWSTLEPSLRAWGGEYQSISSFFQINDFHDDFQQILNGTNLSTLLKLNPFCTGEWNRRTATTGCDANATQRQHSSYWHNLIWGKQYASAAILGETEKVTDSALA